MTTRTTISTAIASESSENQLHAVTAEPLSTMVREVSTKDFEAMDRGRQGTKTLTVRGCEVCAALPPQQSENMYFVSFLSLARALFWSRNQTFAHTITPIAGACVCFHSGFHDALSL